MMRIPWEWHELACGVKHSNGSDDGGRYGEGRRAATRWFGEQVALLLCKAGLPRMSARVLAHDADHFTATELANGIRVSPAAISGAVRHLVQSGLMSRSREPGSRCDTYGLEDSDIGPFS